MTSQSFAGFVEFLLVFAVIIVAVAVLVVMRRRQDAARDAAYQAYCDQRGYLYAAARPGEEKRYVPMLDLFNEGTERLWNCEVSGTLNGRPFTAFEFRVIVGAGRYRRTQPFAFMRWEREGDALPDFFLTPIDELNRDEYSGTSTRVEFADDTIFTFAYALLASDPDATRAWFSPERRGAIRPLLQADPQQYVRASGPTLFWYQTGSLPQPEHMDTFIAFGDKVAGAVLDY